MLNNISIMGRLVADPELKRTGNGTEVTSFRIACERDFYKKDGGQSTDFLDVTAWTGAAVFVCKYFKKGSLIAINGRLSQRSYTDRNGEKRNAVEIVAENVYFAESKKANHDDEPFELPDDTFELDDDDDALPF